MTKLRFTFILYRYLRPWLGARFHIALIILFLIISLSPQVQAQKEIVWDDLTDHLKQFSSGTQIVKELERLLVAA